MGREPDARGRLPSVTVPTDLGWVGLVMGATGLRYATLPRSTRAEAEAEVLAAGGGDAGGDPRLEEAATLLQAYAQGKPVPIESYPVELPPCTPLQARVWLALREIPRGEVWSYGWLAAYVGRPGAARAIGRIVGSNPLPLWLPCHRVVAADGSLHGYGGGLELKARLLQLEGARTVALAGARQAARRAAHPTCPTR